jgi:hypothetical protein
MKKVLFIIVCAMVMVSCVQTPIEGGTKSGSIGDYTIILIDGCEYLEYRKGSGDNRVYSLTHKGNCNNTAHMGYKF